jgi:integrase/recombinase XerD
MIQDLQIRNYSKATVEIYTAQIAALARFFKKSPDQLNLDHIREYQVHLVQTRKASVSWLKQFVCAARFFFNFTLRQNLDVKFIPHPRKERHLPFVLSVEQVASFLKAVPNLKHRTLLMLAYDTGLRVSELVNLRVQDIYSQRMLIHVHHGKGASDRVVPLSPNLLKRLRKYWKIYKPTRFLFPGSSITHPMDPSVVQKVCQRASARAGLPQRATPHTLRHSFATHAMEAGFNSRILQKILGHKRFGTTEGYTHVTDRSVRTLQSPLDLLPDLD